MIGFVLVALFTVAAGSAILVLVDSALRGARAHSRLRSVSRTCAGNQIVRITIIEPAGMKAPAPFKIPAFTRSAQPVAANCPQPLPEAA